MFFFSDCRNGLSVALSADAQTTSNLPPSMSSQQISYWAKYQAVKFMASTSIIWSLIIIILKRDIITNITMMHNFQVSLRATQEADKCDSFWPHSHETFNAKSLVRKSQSAMSRAIQCILISINYSHLYLIYKINLRFQEFKLCYARYEKPLKTHPLDVAKKYVETYSSSNAPDPEERAFFN